MTSRDRILAAIRHQEPDRVPIDMGATPSSGISAIAYGRLKRHLGITRGHNRVYDVVQQLAQPEEDILNRFNIDVVNLGRTFDVNSADWYEVKLFDGSEAQYPAWFHPSPSSDGGWLAHAPDGTEIATQLKNMNFFDQTCFPWLDDYPSDLTATVRGDVLERLGIFAPGGGFVFNTIHNILPDVPPENIVAMFEAIEEYNTAGA